MIRAWNFGPRPSLTSEDVGGATDWVQWYVQWVHQSCLRNTSPPLSKWKQTLGSEAQKSFLVGEQWCAGRVTHSDFTRRGHWSSASRTLLDLVLRICFFYNKTAIISMVLSVNPVESRVVNADGLWPLWLEGGTRRKGSLVEDWALKPVESDTNSGWFVPQLYWSMLTWFIKSISNLSRSPKQTITQTPECQAIFLPSWWNQR